MSRGDISLEELMLALSYCPDTGKFTWNAGVHESLNGREAGTITVEFSGVPAGHLSNHPAGGTSAGTQG